jgi:pyruvate dehydrogenase E1 component alpha subunit
MNMAAIWKLPVVFVLENNHYGVSTRIEESVAIQDLSIRAQGYGMPGMRVDGFDVLAVYEAATEAVARARRGEGPTLLVTESYRIEGHYSGEPEVYRTRAEVEEYRKKDPIPRFRGWLLENGRATAAELDAIEAAMKQEIADAVQFAKDSPLPDPATAMDYIYV